MRSRRLIVRGVVMIAGAPLLMATSCIESFDLRVSPRPESGGAEIAATKGNEPVALRSLSVERCRPTELPHVAWSIARPDSLERSAPAAAIMYGQAPAGFVETAPAEALAPGGCYDVRATAAAPDGGRISSISAWSQFRVLQDGTVKPGWVPVYPGAQLRTALGRCRTAFHRARTPADTAAADAHSFPVADTTVTCGLVRTRLAARMRAEPGTRENVLAIARSAGILAAILFIASVAH